MKISRLFLIVSLAFAGVIIAGCSSTRVYSDYVEGINYNQFDSFAWLPNSDTAQTSLYENDIVMQNLRSQVNQELRARGLQINTENPDLLVLMRVNFSEEEELVQSPVYSSYNYYYPGFYAGPGYPHYYYHYNTIPNVYGYDIRSVEFTQGTIVIDIIRAETKELIWRGWANNRVYDPEDFRKDMNETVENIMDEFPVEESRG